MDTFSMMDDDPTLPIDFDQSTNLIKYLTREKKDGTENLQRILLSQEESISNSETDSKPSSARNDLNDPDRATMRDHEEVIGAFKKENFGLKLRIYFLEERLQMAYEGDTEDLLKTNIELKVSIEQLKKDLTEKQQLLIKASKAMESISVESEKHINKLKDEFTNQFNEMRDQLQDELDQREKEIIENHNHLEELNQKLLETDQLKRELEGFMENSQVDPQFIEELRLKQKEVEEKYEKEVQEKDLKIKELMQGKSSPEAENKIQDLEDVIAEKDAKIKNLQDGIKDLASQSPDRSNKHYEALYNKLVTENDQNEKKIKDLSKELRTKTNLVQELKDYINKTDRVNKELRNSIHDKETEKHRSSMSLQEHIRWKLNNRLRELLSSVRLDLALSNKEKEVNKYREEIQKLENLLKELQEELDAAKLKLKEIDSASNKEKTETLAALLADLQEKDFILKKNRQALEDKDKDIQYFNSSKLRAEQESQNIIAQKNLDIQALREDFKKVAADNKDRMNALEDQCQRLQEDAQIQLNKKDKLIERLANAVRSKDLMIQDLATPAEGLDVSSEGLQDNHSFLIQKLRTKIKDFDHSIEASLDDKFKAINEKDQELLEMKRTVRGKDRDVEALKANISTCEGVIKHLESLGQEKDKTLHGLKTALEMQSNAFKVSAEAATNSIEDCQLKIIKLTSLLDAKENAATSDENKKEPLDEINSRQKMIENLTSERDAAFHRNEANRQKFISVLNENDLHLKDLFNMMTSLSDEKNATIKQLNNSLEQKKGEIVASDNKLTEARKEFDANQNMHQQNVDKKDMVIQDFVKSGLEKDRVIGELHEHLQMRPKVTNVDGNVEVETLKEICSRLTEELKKKEEEIEGLKADRKKLQDDYEKLRGSENIEITLKFDNLKHELEGEKKHLKEARNQVEELRKEKEKVPNIIDGFHDKIQALQTDKISQMKQIEELIKLCEDKDMALRDSQTQVNFGKDVQETLKKLQEQKVNLEQRLRELHSEASSLKSSKDAVEKKLTEVTELNSKLTAELEELKSKLQSSVTLDEAEKLRAEIHELKSEINQERPLPKRDSKPVGAGEDEVDSSDLKELLKWQLQQQKTLLNAVEQERLRYQNLANDLQNKNQSSSQTTDLEFELESISALRSQYEEGLRQNEALREHLEKEAKLARGSQYHAEKSPTAEEEIMILTGQLEESERWNRSLQSRLDQMSPRSGGVGGSKDQVDSESRNPFQAEITLMVDRLQNERDDLQERLKMQQAECSLLRKELREGGSESNEARASLAEFKLHYDQFSQLRNKEIETLTTNCEEAKNVIRSMEKEISALNAESQLQKRLQNNDNHEAVTKQMMKIDELNDVLRKELNEKIEEVRSMQEQAREAEEINNKFKANCETLSKDKKILMKQIEEKNSELKTSKEKLEQLKRNIDMVEKEKHLLEKQVKDYSLLQEDRDELRVLNERLRSKLAEVSKTYENLKDANDGEIATVNEGLRKANSRIEELQLDNDEANAITMRLRDEIRELQDASRNVQRLTGELRNSQNINKVLQRQLNDVAKASELRQNALDPEMELIKQRMHQFQRANSDLQEQLRDYERQLNMLKNELSRERNNSVAEKEGFEMEMQRLVNEFKVTEEGKRSLELQVKELSYIAESYKTMIERLEDQIKRKEEVASRLEKELSRQKMYADISTSMTPQKTANFVSQTTPTKLSAQPEHQPMPDVALHEAVQKRDAYIVALRQQLEFYKHEKENTEHEKHARDNQSKEKTDNLIAMHIAEMRELRKELEQSIRNNDALRAQLEHRLSQAEKEAAQFRDPQMRASLLRENDNLRARIQEKDTRIKSLQLALEKAEKSKEEPLDASFGRHQPIKRKDFESTRLDYEQMQKFAPQETSSAITSPLNSITSFTQTTPSKGKASRSQETQVDTYAAQIAAEKRDMQMKIDVFRETVRSKEEMISSLEQAVKPHEAAREQQLNWQVEVDKLKKSLLEKDHAIQTMELKLKNLVESRSVLAAESDSRTSRESRGSHDSRDSRRFDRKSTNDDLIALHISEMRELKKELELSIKNNDTLRSQLEHRLQMVERDAEYIKDPDLRAHVIRDNDILRTQTIERQNIATRQKAKIDELLIERQKDKEKLKRLHQQIHDLNKLTSNLQQEVGLYNRLQEQLNATTARNITTSCSPDSGIHLRSKTPASGYKSGKEAVKEDNAATVGFDASLLQMLLEEIRILRTQLQKSIDANIALREKLEQQLGKPLDTSTLNSSNERSTAAVILDPRSNTIRRTLFSSETEQDNSEIDNSRLHQDTSKYAPQETPTKENGSPGTTSYLLSPNNLAAVFHEAKSQQVLVRGKIEDYITLKNRLANCCQRVVLMQDLHAVLQMHKSVNAAQISDLRTEIDKVSLDLKECRQLLDLMWTEELPKADENVDKAIIGENQQLKCEILNLKKKLSYQDKLIKSSLKRLEESNKVKGDLEQKILEKLKTTHGTMIKASQNLEDKIVKAKTPTK